MIVESITHAFARSRLNRRAMIGATAAGALSTIQAGNTFAQAATPTADQEETTMTYDISGRLLEVCTCNVLCPCWVGEDPDGGTCDSVFGWAVDEGTIEGIDVGGEFQLRQMRLGIAIHRHRVSILRRDTHVVCDGVCVTRVPAVLHHEQDFHRAAPERPPAAASAASSCSRWA